MQVQVELKKGETIMTDAALHLPASFLHEAFSNRSGVPPDHFELYYRGKRLEGEAALASWGVGKDSTIEVKMRGRGGKGSPEPSRPKRTPGDGTSGNMLVSQLAAEDCNETSAPCATSSVTTVIASTSEVVTEEVAATKSLSDGLKWDVRCDVGTREELAIDYEEALTSQNAEWSFLVVMRVNKSVGDARVGLILGGRDFNFEVHERGRLRLWWVPDGSAADDAFSKSDVRDGQWHVAAFSRDSQAVHIYLDGECVYTGRAGGGGQSGRAAGLPMRNLSGPLYIGGGQESARRKWFQGDVARLAVYDRVLSTAEMGLLAHDYLAPRLVALHGRYGNVIDSVKFLFNNGLVATYGGKGGGDAPPVFSLKPGEHVVAVRGKNTYYPYLASTFSATTNRGREFTFGTDGSQGIDWHFKTSAAGSEIIGLDVEAGGRVVGVLERLLPQGNALKCQHEAEQGYLSLLEQVKAAAAALNAQLSAPIDLPGLLDWELEAKRVWFVALKEVRRERHKPLIFLEQYEMDRGPPLHVSATAAVFAATRNPDSGAVARTGAENDGGRRRVVLKFMSSPLQVLSELTGRAGLGPEYVVAVAAVFCESGGAATALSAYPGKKPLEYDGVPVVVQERANLAGQMQQLVASRSRSGVEKAEYQYCLELELAEANLNHALIHEHFAGQDWLTVRKIASDLAKALDHLHSCGRIHGDLKPPNAVRIGTSWQLIDLDVSCIIDDPFGNKVPSSGYCPPEMAIALLASTDSHGAVDASQLKDHYRKASVAYDLWSLGCILYQMVFDGLKLWNTDHDDNVSSKDLRKLAERSTASVNRALAVATRGGGSKEAMLAKDLLKKLLEASPQARLNHFDEGAEMNSVLNHSFFQFGGEAHPDVMAQLNQIQLMQKAQMALQESMNRKLDKVIEMLAAQFAMLSTILSGVEKLMPKLICFVPSKQGQNRTLLRTLMEPTSWLNQKVLLYFVDPITLSVAPTNNGDGFEIAFPKEWVARAMPYMKVVCTALKVAAIAGRLTGIPIPDIGGMTTEFLDSQLTMLGGLKDEATQFLIGQTKNAALAGSLLKDLDSHCQSMLQSAADGIKPVGGNSLDQNLQECIEKSAMELKTLLDDKFPNWADKSGLEMVTANDGSTEWVLVKHAEEFKEKGKALIGSKSIRPPDQSADSATTLEVKFAVAAARAKTVVTNEAPAEVAAATKKGFFWCCG